MHKLNTFEYEFRLIALAEQPLIKANHALGYDIRVIVILYQVAAVTSHGLYTRKRQPQNVIDMVGEGLYVVVNPMAAFVYFQILPRRCFGAYNGCLA